MNLIRDYKILKKYAPELLGKFYSLHLMRLGHTVKRLPFVLPILPIFLVVVFIQFLAELLLGVLDWFYKRICDYTDFVDSKMNTSEVTERFENKYRKMARIIMREKRKTC